MKESDIERRFCKKLEERGYTTVKFGQDGWPDRIVMGPEGWVAFIEFKEPGKNPTPRQKERIQYLADNKHIVYVIKSYTPEILNEFLGELEAAPLPDNVLQ